MKLKGAIVTLVIGLLLVPLFALVLFSSPAKIMGGMQHRLFLSALLISFKSSITSLIIILFFCTPIAWFISQKQRLRTTLSILIDIPIILPPAVLGIGLLIAFNPASPLSRLAPEIGTNLVPVIIAQVIVGAPFYLKAGMNAFDKVSRESILVARSLGASERASFYRVALPMALPGILNAMTLCFARIVGEFGATLIFAGNIPMKTQTLPMAIFQIYDSNIDLAVAISVVLALGTVLLFAIISIISYRLLLKRHHTDGFF